MRRLLATDRGFSIVESLVAALIVASVLAGLAQLVATSSVRTTESRRSARAVAMAQAKLEELRGLSWTFDLNGTTSASPLLQPSPPGTIAQDTPGYVEYLDPFGALVARQGPPEPEFARRWAIALHPPLDGHTLELQVCVFAVLGPASVDVRPAACASGIRTRRS